MNKILVANNKIDSDIDGIIIKDNVITFNKDGEYLLEYISNGNYKIKFVIDSNVKLIETSFDKELNLNNKYIINNGELKVVKFYNNKKENEIKKNIEEILVQY